ncbi:hypothetical protein [Ekhidna sp.]
MVKFSITLSNHIKVTAFTWQTSILYFVICYFLGFDLEGTLVGFGLFSLFIIPSFYLHLEYWITNYGQVVEIENHSLKITKKGVSNNYQFSEIKKVIVYKSASLDKGGIPFSTMEYYNYARIILKSGEEIILTCLLSPRIDKITDQITGVAKERKRGFFHLL